MKTGGCAVARAEPAFCQVTQFDKHHCGYQRVIEGVVLSEGGAVCAIGLLSSGAIAIVSG